MAQMGTDEMLKKGSCLRAKNSWDEETTKTSPSTRLRKQSPMNFPNKCYCIFSQSRQKMALTFHLPHLADPLSLLYTHLPVPRQISLSLFIRPTNTYGVLCCSGLVLGNQNAEVTKEGLCLQRETGKGLQLQSVLPCGGSSYPVWIIWEGCLEIHLNSNTKTRKSQTDQR